MNDALRLSSAAPEQVAPLFAPDLEAPLFCRLMGEHRFRDRLLTLAAERLGAFPDAGPNTLTLLKLDRDDLHRFVSRVGAAWHGAALACTVEGESRRRLAAGLGPDLMRYAITARDIAPETRAPVQDPDTLINAIPREGAAAFAAWCAVQPQAVSRRLDLVRPPAEVGALHLSAGPALVEWVLAHP